MSVLKRLEQNVARCCGNGCRVSVDFLIIICLAMKLEAGNMQPCEGDDVAIRCRDMLQRLNVVDVVLVGEQSFTVVAHSVL